MTDARRHDRLAVAGLIVLPTLLFADVVLGLTHLSMRDLTAYYYPTKQIYREIILSGEFPLWNRSFAGGQPLAANPEHEVFYPFTWLLLLPSYDLGYRLHILVHLYIGLIGMYLLLRSLRLRPAAAFFGAVSWGLGGVYLSSVSLLPILFCAAWLPLTCLFVRRFLLERRPRDFALAALFLGLQFLVAEPTTLVQTVALVGLYGLYEGWKRADARVIAVITNTAWIATIVAAAFAVGAVQMLPAIDHAFDSVRSRPIAFDVVRSWSMPAGRLAELVYPHVFGHIDPNRYWGWRLYLPQGAPFWYSIYPGIAVAALAIGAVAARVRGSGFALLLFGGSFLLAIGDQTPLLRLLYEARIASSIRYFEKFMLLGIFAITVLAAVGLEAIFAGNERLRRTAAAVALVVALVAAAITLLGFSPLSIDLWSRTFDLPRDPKTLAMAGEAWTDWTIAAARGLLLFLLLVTMRTRRRGVWTTAAALLWLADLAVVVHPLNQRVPSRFFTTPPATERLFPPNRHEYRVFHQGEWFADSEMARKFSMYDRDMLRKILYPPTPAAYGIQMALERDFDETSLLPTRDYLDSFFEVRERSEQRDWARPFLAMSNVRYVVVFRQFEKEWIRTGGDSAKMLPIALVNASRLPRYYFADQIVQIDDRRQFVENLVANRYSDRVAFVRSPSFTPAAGRILMSHETANDATLEVEAQGRAFLVMSVTPHKYWRVTIDGRQATPIVTNIGYQGVVVPAGRHRIEMHYRNDMIALGAPISAGTSALLIVGAVFASRRRRPVAVA